MSLGEGDQTTLTEAYECDYERNCIPLYKAIETAEDEEEYEAILDFLDTGVWTGPFAGAKGPPPLEQVKTWVTRFDPNDENKVKWSQLPLHLAIVCGAPAQIVASLVKLYPEALRCTDDQHMLPLHLALRHEADDEVLAFLLIQFPEAVHARGKNGRSPVDCALRAKDKLRGIILEIFTEKTAAKITAQMSKEKKEISSELENRTSELLATSNLLEDRTKDLEVLKTKYEEVISEFSGQGDIQSLQKAKAEIEADYQEKFEKLKSEKLLNEVLAQKKIDQLLSSLKEKEVAAAKARAEEIAIKRELETVQARVAASDKPADWKAVQEEVESLKSYRLQKTRSETKSTINNLKSELEKSIAVSKQTDDKLKTELKGELKSLRTIVDKLQRTESTAKTSSELTALRNEVDAIRSELKERAQVKQTKVELSVMKKSLESELKNAEGKSKEDLDALKKAVEAASPTELETKTAKELAAIKEEFDSLKRELQEKELASKTKQEMEDLQATLEREMMNADSKTKAELNNMKKLVESLQYTLANNTSTDDMVAVKQEVEALKEEFKKKETASKIKLEAALLKKMVEAELKQSEGKTQEELLQMKQAIKMLSDKALDNKDVDELAKVKAELNLVKEELKEIDKISKTQQELEILKRNLEQEINYSKGKTEGELLAMKKALAAMNSEYMQSKELKKSLETEIKNASGKTDKELKQLKKSIDMIDLRKLESKNRKEWETIRKEMDILTAYLKKRQMDGVGETQNELRRVKAAVAAIDIDQIESKHRSEFEFLRSEMEAMKAEMKQKEIEEANLKRELETVKNTQFVKSMPKKKKGWKCFLSRNIVNNGKKLGEVFSAKSHAKPEVIVERREEVATILPPRGATRDVKVDENQDDASCSSAMKDAEISRQVKKEVTRDFDLRISKSREYEAKPREYEAKPHFDSTQEGSASVMLDWQSNSTGTLDHSKDDSKSKSRDDGEFRIVSLYQSKSEVANKGIAAPSLKKTKSDNGLHSPKSERDSIIAEYLESRDQPEYEKKTKIVSEQQQPGQKKPLYSAMKGSKQSMLKVRKVKSFDPKFFTKNMSDDSDEASEDIVSDKFFSAYNAQRTRSLVSDSGDVELQPVEEDEDDSMIQPRVSFVSHF